MDPTVIVVGAGLFGLPGVLGWKLATIVACVQDAMEREQPVVAVDPALEFLNTVLPLDPLQGVGREWADNHALTDRVNSHGTAQIALARQSFCDHTMQTSDTFIERVSSAVAEHALDEWQDPEELRRRREEQERQAARQAEENKEYTEAKRKLKEAFALREEAAAVKRTKQQRARGNNPFAPAPSKRRLTLAELNAKLTTLEEKAAAITAAVERDYDVERLKLDQISAEVGVVVGKQTTLEPGEVVFPTAGRIKPGDIRTTPLYTDDIVLADYVVPFT